MTYRSNFSLIEDGLKQNVLEKAKQITSKTLIIYGSEDKGILVDKLKLFSKTMSDSKLILLSGANHNLKINEDWKMYNNILLNWWNTRE